jgi:hypothetical protein
MNVSRPEHDVLFAIARRELAPHANETICRLVKSGLDWDYLLATARQHGLIPLLQRNANKAAADLLPGHVKTKLKQESVANAQSVLYLASQAVKVAKLFEENGISVAIFKGPILSKLAYGETSLRQAGDIDVLISREQFVRVKELMQSLGFQMYPQLTPAQEASHLAFHCEIQFMRDDWFTVVDLHWGLTPKSFVFGMTGEEIMSRLQTVSLGGAQLKTFALEDLLLYQAMHGAKHLWRKLEWIASLAELVGTIETAAWKVVIERTLKARATRILALGLRLTERLFQIEVPREVLSAIDDDNEMKVYAEKVCDQLFIGGSGLTESTESNIHNFKIMDRKRDALLSTSRALFVPTLSDWQALTLPASLHSLYYAVRPFRLSKVYSTALVRRLMHKPVS